MKLGVTVSPFFPPVDWELMKYLPTFPAEHSYKVQQLFVPVHNKILQSSQAAVPLLVCLFAFIEEDHLFV